MQALLAAMQGRTVLMITHRLAGVEAADRALVLREGRAAEVGVPGDLLARPELLLAQMWADARQGIAEE